MHEWTNDDQYRSLEDQISVIVSKNKLLDETKEQTLDRVVDQKDKISWSFIDPSEDIKSVTQEIKGFNQEEQKACC